jgi:pimeloyl-ACP methyl ester carboxylesterase
MVVCHPEQGIMNFWSGLFLLLAAGLVQAADIEKISLPLIPDLQRADIYVLKLTEQPAGLLVLCPGLNGNGKDWIENPVWQKFAREYNLDLIGISFASDESLLKNGRGYYYARLGSGRLLLDGIRQAYSQDLPLLLYGFSGGAHFTSGFVEWKPERVAAWCAYSAEWWDKPVSNDSSPPGLVACGENDLRLGPSLIYFKQGRALGKPWLWLCAPKTGHSIYPPAEDFIRGYFAAILKNNGAVNSGEWVDIDQKSKAKEEVLESQPSATGWLPDPKLLSQWQEVHQP